MEGFSAAHAASFAELSYYASAYMRRQYPAEFFAAVLNSQPMGFYSPRTLVNEARRVGLAVLPPDVHLSGEGFTVEEDGRAIRVGLSYAKHLSRAANASILAERKKRPFASVLDLYSRTAVEKDGLGSLIRGGFLDTLGGRRDALLDAASRLQKKRPGRRGQKELPLPHTPRAGGSRGSAHRAGYLPLTEDRRERMEWEALTLNASRHPLAPYRGPLGELGAVPSSRMISLPHGTRARAVGLLESLQRPPTRSGRPVYFLLVDDEWGLLQATIFRPVYERYGELPHHEGAFLLEGVVEQDADRGFSFLVRHIESLREVLADAKGPAPKAASSSGAFLRAGRQSQRAG